MQLLNHHLAASSTAAVNAGTELVVLFGRGIAMSWSTPIGSQPWGSQPPTPPTRTCQTRPARGERSYRCKPVASCQGLRSHCDAPSIGHRS